MPVIFFLSHSVHEGAHFFIYLLTKLKPVSCGSSFLATAAATASPQKKLFNSIYIHYSAVNMCVCGNAQLCSFIASFLVKQICFREMKKN